MYGIADARTSQVRTATGAKTVTANRTAAAPAPSGSPARAMSTFQPACSAAAARVSARASAGTRRGYRTSVRIAPAWRATAAAVIGPAGSSTAKDDPRAKWWFCHRDAVPPGFGLRNRRSPTMCAYRRAAAVLRPEAQTSRSCWWYQTERVGRTRSMRRWAARVSGSENGRGPESYVLHGTPWRVHPALKLRLRSTPCPFWRVPAARPSGFRVGTSHMSNIRGGRIRRSRRTTAVPAHSLPWMQPTTITRRGACGAPDSVAMIARPPAEVPICCVTWTDGPYGPTVISGSAASSAGSAGTAPSYALGPLRHLRHGAGGDREE